MRHPVGRAAEALAWAHLERRGARLLHQRLRVGRDELDLVVLDGERLVFVEVRYRGRGAWQNAAASVGPRKQARLLRAAARYVRRFPEHRHRRVRMDVIAVARDRAGLVVDQLRDAFRHEVDGELRRRRAPRARTGW